MIMWLSTITHWLQIYLKNLVHYIGLTYFRDDLAVDKNSSGTCLTDLHDDIVINILSRLPVSCIMNLQTVCKKWLALTSSLHFAETHFKSGAKSQISNDNELDLFILDTEAERYKLVKIMCNGFVRVMISEVSPMLVGSCDGLLVFQMFRETRFLVWNLVTREYAYIDAPAHCLSLSAIFSCSATHGFFKLLFSSQIKDRESGYRYEFFVYEFQNKVWRKLSTSSFYPPMCSINHVVVNPTIYKNSMFWMALCPIVEGFVEHPPPCRNSVVIFNMDIEEFRSMPHPGDECRPNADRHDHMYFFEVKGKLYFCYNSITTIGIWSLEGYDRWYWVKKHNVKTDYALNAISSIWYPSETYGFDTVRLMKIEDDSIFFRCCYRGLFIYDWMERIVKKLDQESKGYVFTYSDSSLSLESGFRCRRSSLGQIHGPVMTATKTRRSKFSALGRRFIIDE